MCNYPAFETLCVCVSLREVNHVTVSFTDFALETSYVNCSHDAVVILDGDNYQAPAIGQSQKPHSRTICWRISFVLVSQSCV